MADDERTVIFKVNDLVFVPDKEKGYTPANVLEEFQRGQEGKVKLKDSGREQSISKKESMKVDRMDIQSFADVEDMISLKLLSEPALLHNLRLRYMAEPKMKIYTNIGAILVAINPFKDLGLYNPEIEDKYLTCGSKLLSMPPHIFKVAEAAFQNMKLEDKDQSCVITGESGAGKTETTKRFLQYVSERSRRNKESSGADLGIDTEQLRMQILDSNPFMEAFGNAKTLRNDNSSRFGKLIEMDFETNKGVVVGASITNYLLEKSRVVRVGKGERNYHIFYQLCAAASETSPELKKKYHLQTADQFNYAKGDHKTISELTIPNESDVEVFEETKAAMKKLKMTQEEIDTTFQICSAILHVGNIFFKGSDKDLSEVQDGVRETSLRFSAELLGVDPAALEKAIVFRSLIGTTTKQHTVAEALQARDALSKFVYEKLFDWLILKMNQAMQQGKSGKMSGTRVLGVLDIFGFETFEVNSFEQMCINFCNEKLQSFFNHHVFKKEQAEYEKEGLDIGEVGFYDNQGVIDAIEKQVMRFCDDLSGLESAKDEQYLRKIKAVCKDVKDKEAHKYFLFKPKIQEIRAKKHLETAFTIKHFAGFVHYNTENFLQKNKDKLQKDLNNLLASSSVELITQFFPGAEGSKKNSKATLGKKFTQSLNKLMSRLNETSPQFVRCIKPNDAKVAGIFDPEKSFKQLNEAGLLEVCKIRKLGYPINVPKKKFFQDYVCIAKQSKEVTDLCDNLKAMGVLYGKTSPNWQIGTTKVFMRPEQARALEEQRSEALKAVLAIIHNFARRYLYRSTINKAVKHLAKIKAAMRKKSPEELEEGLRFFIEQGPLFAGLPFVVEAQNMMKELEVELRVINELKAAVENEDFTTMKVKVALAQEIGLTKHAIYLQAMELLETMEMRKEVIGKLEDALGSQEPKQLEEAIAGANEAGLGTCKQCRQAEQMLTTIKEREKWFALLDEELKKEDSSRDNLIDIIESLRKAGCPDDDPRLVAAVRKADIILEVKAQQENMIKKLEKQLSSNIKKKNLDKLKELVDAAIKIQYHGPLVKTAIELTRALGQRQELLDEVSNATRVLREKSKLPDGVKEADLVPLRHAIKTATSVPTLNLGEELQVIEGERLLQKMLEQIKVQANLNTALQTATKKDYYKLLEKVQALGLQTKDSDILVQKVREIEMLKAKSHAIANDTKVADLRAQLACLSFSKRKRHLVKRLAEMYNKEFRKQVKEAGNSRDLAMKSYYKVRSDADYVSKEHKTNKDSRKKMKHAYEDNMPLTKSLIEMDDMQEKKALQISLMINKLCDSISGNQKSTMESAMSFVVEHGICDPVIADEIYIQLAKKLTANPNSLSKNKAWYLLCLSATYFGCTKRFLPYLLHFLQNVVNDVGLEGNYARYTLAQLSCSMNFDAAKERIKPSSDEIKGFFMRPPVLAQLELVSGKREDIPIPPDMNLQEAALIIRKATGVMIELEKPEWSIYVRATIKPPKQTWKTRLENFYRVYKPENLGNVDQILAYYKGHEQSLFNDLTSTSNYGPEPMPVKVGPKKRKAAPKPKNPESTGEGGNTPAAELEELFGDDDAQSQFSMMSKSSISSVVSSFSQSISRVFKRARGITKVDKADIDLPNPTIAWPLPWATYLGDVMRSLYEQDLVPVLNYKRRLCKSIGIPDENLFLQLQRDFLDGLLAPFTEGENAKLSAILLCVRLLKAKKNVPFGDGPKMVKAGLLKCIPKKLKKANKKNTSWLDAYVDLAASRSEELADVDIRKLQTLFFEDCVKFPTYGMSFFFAQVLKGNVKSYIARAQTPENEGVVKIGINRNEVAFFQDGQKHKSIMLKSLVWYKFNGTAFTMKFKNSIDHKVDEYGDDPEATLPRPKKKGFFAKAFKTIVKNVLGGGKDVIQLYTLQPKEIFDLIYYFKELPDKEEE